MGICQYYGELMTLAHYRYILMAIYFFFHIIFSRKVYLNGFSSQGIQCSSLCFHFLSEWINRALGLHRLVRQEAQILERDINGLLGPEEDLRIVRFGFPVEHVFLDLALYLVELLEVAPFSRVLYTTEMKIQFVCYRYWD